MKLSPSATQKMTPEAIAQVGNVKVALAEHLLRGVTKDDLEQMLDDHIVPQSPSLLELSRMNLIGGLRADGYTIPRTRGFYHVVGWDKKLEYLPASEWVGKIRETLDWIESLPRLVRGHEEMVNLLFKHNTVDSQTFEACWGYLYSYEAARDRAFLYHSEAGGFAVILWKFKNAPRLRIFNLTLAPQELTDLAQELAPASLMAIRVVHPNLSKAECHMFDNRASFTKRKQAWYDIQKILDNLNTLYSKKQRSLLRQHARKTDLSTERSIIDENSILAMWKKENEPKQRQLAIGRDFKAVEKLDGPSSIHLVGHRHDPHLPCCFQILSRHPASGDLVSQLVEKALNYRHLPGGQSGTSDFSFVEGFAHLLRSEGIEYVNGGDIDGGTAGLAKHKMKLCFGTTVSSKVITFDFPILDRATIVKETTND